MWFLLSLTLVLAAPRNGPTPDPFAGLPSAAQAAFTDYVETRQKLGQTLELLETRTLRGETRALFLEKTTCLRGWVVLSSTAPQKPTDAPTFEAREFFDQDCKAPGPMTHFARLMYGLARRDATAAATYFDKDLHLPVAVESKNKMTRKTLTGDAISRALTDPKQKPPLPLCDLFVDTPSCTHAATADTSGTIPITCECVSAGRRLTYEMRVLEPSLGPNSRVQVVSVKDRR